MSDVIILVRVVCLAIALFGAMLALAAEKNGNPVPIIIGIVISVVSMMGVYALGEPYTEALKKEAESGTKYKAAYQNEIKSFVDCYKENGFNVCETKDGKEMVVEHYWKKKMNPRRKKEKRKTTP